MHVQSWSRGAPRWARRLASISLAALLVLWCASFANEFAAKAAHFDGDHAAPAGTPAAASMSNTPLPGPATARGLPMIVAHQLVVLRGTEAYRFPEHEFETLTAPGYADE